MKFDCKKQQKSIQHLKSVNEAVNLDEYAEFIIELTAKIKADKVKNLKDIFLAADMDYKEHLNFDDLDMLY